MMPENVLVKMKTGTIEDLQSKTEDQPNVPLDEGSVYFAVDTENHIGQIVYDAPDGAGGVDRIVMSTYGEHADTATQWAAPTVTYVDLSTASTLTTLQGNESSPVALGVDGTLGIAHGGTGGTTASEARINLGVGNAKIYAATCATAATTGNKVATCEDLTTVPTGTLISVTFDNTNTASTNNLSLNINNTGSLPIRLFRNGVAEVLDHPESLSTGPHIFRKGTNCWYIVDSVEEKITAVNSSTPILAKSTISANRIIVTEDPTDGYIALASGVDFNINYPIFFSTTGINAAATSKTIYSHYGDVNFSSIRGTLTGDPYSTIYIKGTLNGNIVTTTTDFLTTVEPTTEDGYVYIPIANAGSDGVTGWFYNTGSVLAFKNGAFVPMAAFAKIQVQKITLSAGNLSADLNNTIYPYKYEFTWTGVQEDDWVDGSGVSEMDWAVESKTNKIILHFAKPLSASTTINVYWAACDVIASSSPPQAPQYNITYNANGGYFGTNMSTTTNTVTYEFIQSGTNYEAIVVSGQVLTPNDIDGYAFDGWYMDQTYTTPLDLTEIPASNDITVYAKYEDVEDPDDPEDPSIWD